MFGVVRQVMERTLKKADAYTLLFKSGKRMLECIERLRGMQVLQMNIRACMIGSDMKSFYEMSLRRE